MMNIIFHKFLKLTKKKIFIYVITYLPICTYLNQNNPLCNNVYNIAIFIDEYIYYFLPFFQWIAMTMSDGNFAKKLSPIMEDFEEEKLKRWESDESTNVCEEFISRVIWAISIIFIVVTFPFSLCVSIRMVQVRNLKVIIFYLYIYHTVVMRKVALSCFLGIS